MATFLADFRFGEADEERKDVFSTDTSIFYSKHHSFSKIYFLIKVLTFCVELYFSINAKCYKILKIEVWPVTASARHRKYEYTYIVQSLF